MSYLAAERREQTNRKLAEEFPGGVDCPVDRLALTPVLKRFLAGRFTTLGDIAALRSYELTGMHGFGDKLTEELIAILELFGLGFRDSSKKLKV